MAIRRRPNESASCVGEATDGQAGKRRARGWTGGVDNADGTVTVCVEETPSTRVSDYTQAMWAQHNRIGCGSTLCGDGWVIVCRPHGGVRRL